MATTKKPTQTEQVINALRRAGGYATIRQLNDMIDYSTWTTKTPRATVRSIVQRSDKIFKIQHGLWALEEARKEVLRKFNLQPGNKSSEAAFSHGYYQGLLVEIGKCQNLRTYVPPQDRHRLFLDKQLEEVADSVEMPRFTYDELMRKARTVDVVWFNERRMPSHFYEVEHTTDIKNSLSKFYELQDFYARFYIVADAARREEFLDKLHASMYNPIKKRVEFLDYERVASMHSMLRDINTISW